jgi:hypothetical protein
MTSADVRSMTAIEDVRNVLRVFQERGDAALDSLRSEVQQSLSWLQHEQPQYWRNQIQRAFDRVATCRVSLETCRNRTIAGHRSECIEEKVALQRAKQRLDYCQEQFEVTRQWATRALEAADTFRAEMSPLARWLECDAERAVAALQKMILALEAYAAPPMEESANDSIAPVAGQATTQSDNRTGPIAAATGTADLGPLPQHLGDDRPPKPAATDVGK